MGHGCHLCNVMFNYVWLEATRLARQGICDDIIVDLGAIPLLLKFDGHDL